MSYLAHYVGKVEVPPYVPDRIGGYDAWTALSWILQHQWVQDTKWLISQRNRRRNVGSIRDIGTPFTVEQLLNPLTSEFKDVLPSELSEFLERVPKDSLEEFRKLMIEGYLLGTDYVSPLWVMKPGGRVKPADLVQTGIVEDTLGGNQLEGELRRYWINERFIYDPSYWIFPIRADHVAGYCDKHSLQESEAKFAERLRL
ncbi:hypothetical protein HYY71_03985 [Candidatus Woesearchaeota archaeon]|nr:hypothetical protein [Candidatus Woesearchaeota archaeon]